MISEQQVRDILQATANLYQRAWQHAHHEGDPERYDWIILAGKALYTASNGEIGLNWRRANVGDLSMDGLSVKGPDGRYYFKDVIGGAGGPNPQIVYNHPFDDASLLRDASGQYAPHGFADPRPLTTHFNYDSTPTPNPNPTPTPKPPPPPPKKQYPGDGPFVSVGQQLEADAREAGQTLNAGSGIWFARTIWDHLNEGLTLQESITKHRIEWRAAMGLR